MWPAMATSSQGGAGEYEDSEGRHWAEECGEDYSERLGVDTAWGDDGWEALLRRRVESRRL